VGTHGSTGLQKTRHRQGRSCGYTRVSRSIEEKTQTGSVMWVHTVNRSIDDNTQRGSVMWVYTRVNRSIEDKTQGGLVMWVHTGQQVSRRQDTDSVGNVATHGSVGL
jgi:hypothetical protein